ncbi:hypothetical protein V3C33_13035 [Micrococcaceae bacterium Sec5.7]
MPTHRTAAMALAASLTVVIGVAACSSPAQPGIAASSSAIEANQGGDIPDNQAFITVKAASGAFDVQVPEGWAETRRGTSISFTDKLNSVALDQSAARAAPTVQSVASRDVSQLLKSAPNFVLKDVTTFTRAGGSGVRMRYTADSVPDPVTHKTVQEAVERYLFWSQGRLAVLTLASPDGTDNVDPWAKVSGSFRWLH